MVGELIMLPLRVGVRATRLWLRATEESFSLAAGATTRVIGVVTSRSSHGAATPTGEATRERARSQRDRPTPPDRDVRETQATEPPVPPPAPAPPRPHAEAKPAPSVEPATPPAPPEPLGSEPEHVSEEPTLVEAFAEPGAEDGAGAEVHIEPPWDGYAEMNAKQVISRLGSATSAELAAVQLYESSKRRRQTILNAVQRELRTRNGSGSPSE